MICAKCKTDKLPDDFHRNRRRPSGLCCYCKECRRELQRPKESKEQRYTRYLKHVERELEYQQNYRKTHPGLQTVQTRRYRSKHPDRARAHTLIAVRIFRGKLKREPCVICGNDKTHAHHPDYSKPLEIVWFCPKHHRQLHKKEKAV